MKPGISKLSPPIQRYLRRKTVFLCAFVLSLSFTATLLSSASRQVPATFSILPVPEPPGFGLVASLQTSDEAMPAELSSPPVLGEKIAGYPVSDIRRIRERHPTTGASNVWHRGFDIATPVGTPVYAPFKGEVAECQEDGEWGIYGVFKSALFPRRYWLLHHLEWCQAGPYIRGDIWARTGSAGTGPHLHIEGWVNGEHYNLAKGWIKGFLDADTLWLGEPRNS